MGQLTWANDLLHNNVSAAFSGATQLVVLTPFFMVFFFFSLSLKNLVRSFICYTNRETLLFGDISGVTQTAF